MNMRHHPNGPPPCNSARCKVRKTIADAFLARFTLSDDEVTLLTSISAPVGSQFFEALKHLQQINEDCKALLITEHQKAGYGN